MSSFNTLHILNKSPQHPRAAQCLALLSEGDALLLTENGVLLLCAGSLPAMGKVFALSPDVSARGIGNTIGDATLVEFGDMVALSLQAQRVISW
ncbi:sulfurtransferase complex subunit TusB [Marinobacter sp. SS8-8]|uniref:sulfurtransferase complex subunit TusB n=1 Tax=Marinobacter sp. SS8-8 TaxID=3050452 RepID=UPI000C49C0B6|nr:sulfurtransferase complex subunit TusB [Marinobacter sp. SS8-8]MAZ04904.1 sulfurtransferase complex subunit TusB [Halomonas sp.]|tara:strand:- start:150381 stop:150662 length:282 start_codon:yes stop_codon:yes gene_type:complete